MTSCSSPNHEMSTPPPTAAVSSRHTTAVRYGSASPYRQNVVEIWMILSAGLDDIGNLPLPLKHSMSQLANTSGGT